MKRAWALLSFAVCAGPLAATEPAAKADSAKGQSIASKICAACHGGDGNSPTPANPKLASQVPEYLQKQLALFPPAGKPDHGRHGCRDRKSTRLNSSHRCISYAVFCLKKKKTENTRARVNSAREDAAQKHRT